MKLNAKFKWGEPLELSRIIPFNKHVYKNQNTYSVLHLEFY